MNKGIFCTLTMIGGGMLGADVRTGLCVLVITWYAAWVMAVAKK